MTKTLKSLQADHAAAKAEAKALAAKRQSGEATPEEIEALRGKLDEIKAIQAEIDEFPDVPEVDDEIKAIDQWSAIPNRRHVPSYAPAGGVANGDGTKAKGGRVELVESSIDKIMESGPFKSLGHFMHATKRVATHGPGADPNLAVWDQTVRAYDQAVKSLPEHEYKAAGLNEFFDAEGGLLVPPQYSNRIWERVEQDEMNLLTLTDRTPVTGKSLTMPAWQDKSRTGDVLYGGARAYWGGEGQTLTSSQPKLRDIKWELNKLYVLMYASEELLEDAPALESRLTRIASKNFVYMINKSIIRGTGSGQPLGLLNSGARITATAVSGQGAGTIVGQNVSDMWARRAPGSARSLVWLYNVDIEPDLDTLNFTASTSAANWVYIGPGGLKDNPEPRLKGRPMYESEHCSAVGTEGDLILWDPQQYGAIVKSTGIKGAVSMHVRFLTDESTFRWTFRMDGRPFVEDPLTPANGATRSPIVTLSSSRT